MARSFLLRKHAPMSDWSKRVNAGTRSDRENFVTHAGNQKGGQFMALFVKRQPTLMPAAGYRTACSETYVWPKQGAEPHRTQQVLHILPYTARLGVLGGWGCLCRNPWYCWAQNCCCATYKVNALPARLLHAACSLLPSMLVPQHPRSVLNVSPG